MKYSIIEEIFYGNRGNGQCVKQSNEEIKLNHQCNELYNDLIKTFNDGQKEQLDKLLNYEGDIDAETAVTYFKEGVKIGLLLLCECMQD